MSDPSTKRPKNKKLRGLAVPNPDRPRCVHPLNDGSGERCKKPPIKGATLCRSHGGTAKQIKEKAQQRLLEAADKVAARLVGIALAENTPPAVVVQAARDLLDRAGLGAAQLVELTARVSTPYDDLLRQYLEARLNGAPSEVDVASGALAEPDNVVDAELIDDGHADDNPTGGPVQYIDNTPSHDTTEPDPAGDWPPPDRRPSAGTRSGPTTAAGFEERAERGQRDHALSEHWRARAREAARAKVGTTRDDSGKTPPGPGRASMDRYWGR